MENRKITAYANFGEQSAAEQQKPRKWNKYAIGCSMLASMTSILLGYDSAVISGASLFIQDQLHITNTQLEIVSGIINIYSLIGSIAAGLTSDWLGRRKTMVLASVIFFFGALLMGIATNYAFLMVGRFVAGVGVGYAFMIAPVYTAEIAPASFRGTLTSFPEVFVNAGVLLGYISNFAFSGLPNKINWRVMFLVGAVPPVFLAVGVLIFMPESPRWLVMQGRLDDAATVLSKISDSPEEAAIRLEDIKTAANINPDTGAPDGTSHGQGVWRDLLLRPTPMVRRILLRAIGIQFFQQASGIDTVVLYSPRIFEKAGLTNKTQTLGATVAVGFTKTIFVLVSTFYLDRVGRRPLVLSSSGGMVISLVILASMLRIIDRQPAGQKAPKGALALSIMTVLTFVGSFSTGMGPIPWVYCSEIFPLRLRAQGASLGTATNRVMSGTMSMSFISLYTAITISGAFYLYAGIAAAGWLFFYFFLQETRGKSLEELEELYKGKETEMVADDEVKGDHGATT